MHQRFSVLVDARTEDDLMSAPSTSRSFGTKAPPPSSSRGLPRLMDYATSWASTLVAYGLGWWSTSSSGGACACQCSCDFSGLGADKELIAVLKAQLDRCGPDQLKIPSAPAAAACVCPAAPLPGLLLALVFAAGCILGGSAGLLCARFVRRSNGAGLGAIEGPQVAPTRGAGEQALRALRSPGGVVAREAPLRSRGRLVLGGDHTDSGSA